MTDEIILSRRVASQPQPHISEGGDCGACVLSALTDLTVPEVYDRLLPTGAPSHYEMVTALDDARANGMLARVNADVPMWTPMHDGYLAFGASGHLFANEWFRYMQMAVTAGYYGIASVVFDKTGAAGQVPPATDHVVLLCGIRILTVPNKMVPGVGTYRNEVLVSCSAKSSPDEEWVEVGEFLTHRGGYNSILVQPLMKERR